MAYLRKRSGRWETTIKLGRQTKSATFDTKQEAQIWAAKMELAVLTGDSEYLKSKESFADVAELYLKNVTPMKKGGHNEKYIINRLLTEDWVKIKISQLTIGHLVEYRDKRLKSLRPSTMKREWALIRSIARYAPTEGIEINQKIFDNLKLPAVYERPIERITPEQEAKLLEVAKLAGNRVKYMVPFIKLALATAMRRGEMCSLEWHEVDLEHRRIFIPAHKAKSGRQRSIPMSDKAYEALCSLSSLRKGSFVLGATGNAVRLAFGRIRALAGLDHIRIHDFRHEAISRFHEAGFTLPEIQSISGHGDLEMLQRYSHASVDNLVAKIGGVK